MRLKTVAIKNCGECPYCKHHMWAKGYCSQAKDVIEDKDIIQKYCPLTASRGQAKERRILDENIRLATL